MSLNTSWDGLELPSLDLPYNKSLRELDDTPRIVEGVNTYITYGGKLIKRPGTIEVKVNPNDDTHLSLRVDRLWVYETLDTPSVTYLIASAFDSSSHTWAAYQIRLDAAGSPAWANIGSYRDLSVSKRAHELVVSRGLAYIKGFPDPARTEKLGTVIFDGSGGTANVRPWGILGPTTPAAISGVLHKLNADITSAASSLTFDSVTSLPATPFNVQIDYEVITIVTLSGTNATSILRGAQGTVAAAHVAGTPIIYRNWTASNHPVAVNMFWAYTYAYKTLTGQISNRAPLETNPDNMPSMTGPFTNLRPKIVVQGNSDTTNIPSIVIYRTTDGGGTFVELETITNTGAGSITYEDKSRVSGAGLADPVRDADLNLQSLSPSLTSNSPPPTTLAPLVTGTDPVLAATPLASYQGRLWYAIGNVVFFSANEELNAGIPEESFPTGLNGNFFRFQHPVVNLEGTSDALYVITTQSVYEISGSTRETFNVRIILNNIGGASSQPRALTKYGDAIVWLTNDLRIAILQGANFRTISEPLGTDLIDALANNDADIDIKYWAELDKEWIVIGAFGFDLSANKVWVYDIGKSSELKKDFWNTPWTIPATAIVSGCIATIDQRRRLGFWSMVSAEGFLVRLTTTESEFTATDDMCLGFASVAYDFRFKTNLFSTVTGDHINVMRRPGLVPVVYNFFLERTVYAGDTDPTVYYYTNDLWTTPIATLPATIPARDDEPLGYRTLLYGLQTKARRIALHVEKLASNELFALQNFAILWNPDAGAGI